MVLLLVRLVEGLRKEDFSPFSSISFAVLRSVCFDVASPRYLISNGLLSLSLSLLRRSSFALSLLVESFLSISMTDKIYLIL